MTTNPTSRLRTRITARTRSRLRTRLGATTVGVVAAVALALSLLVGLAVGTVGLASADAGAAKGAAERPTLGSTVVSVRGGYGNGFTVVHFDHSRDHLPTLSERMAECGELSTRVQRVRCWTETRTHYADLLELRRALQHQKDLRHHTVHATHGHH